MRSFVNDEYSALSVALATEALQIEVETAAEVFKSQSDRISIRI